jgi:CheY-like chemotaxis protein
MVGMGGGGAMASKRILVAESDDELRTMLTLLLTRHLAEKPILFEAADGREAIALALHEKPDLIVLDETLPKLQGTTVCHELKMDPETAPIKILMLTGWHRRMPYLLKADAYLDKPIDPGELLRKVERLLKE